MKGKRQKKKNNSTNGFNLKKLDFKRIPQTTMALSVDGHTTAFRM